MIKINKIIDLQEKYERMVVENFSTGEHCGNKKYKDLDRWFKSKIENMEVDCMGIYMDLQGDLAWVHEIDVLNKEDGKLYNVIEWMYNHKKEMIQSDIFNNVFTKCKGEK